MRLLVGFFIGAVLGPGGLGSPTAAASAGTGMGLGRVGMWGGIMGVMGVWV